MAIPTQDTYADDGYREYLSDFVDQETAEQSRPSAQLSVTVSGDDLTDLDLQQKGNTLEINYEEPDDENADPDFYEDLAELEGGPDTNKPLSYSEWKERGGNQTKTNTPTAKQPGNGQAEATETPSTASTSPEPADTTEQTAVAEPDNMAPNAPTTPLVPVAGAPAIQPAGLVTAPASDTESVDIGRAAPPPTVPPQEQPRAAEELDRDRQQQSMAARTQAAIDSMDDDSDDTGDTSSFMRNKMMRLIERLIPAFGVLFDDTGKDLEAKIEAKNNAISALRRAKITAGVIDGIEVLSTVAAALSALLVIPFLGAALTYLFLTAPILLAYAIYGDKLGGPYSKSVATLLKETEAALKPLIAKQKKKNRTKKGLLSSLRGTNTKST